MPAAKLLYQEFYLWHLWNIFFPPALLNAGVGTKGPTTMVPLKFQILKLQVEYIYLIKLLEETTKVVTE